MTKADVALDYAIDPQDPRHLAPEVAKEADSVLNQLSTTVRAVHAVAQQYRLADTLVDASIAVEEAERLSRIAEFQFDQWSGFGLREG